MSLNVNKTSYDIGLFSEELATKYLIDNGFSILENRYKSKYGEIDIIASKGKSLHFVEVKKRNSEIEGLYSITNRQKSRIENTAEIYLSKLNNHIFEDIFFDVIILSKFFKMKHIMSAWRAGDS